MYRKTTVEIPTVKGKMSQKKIKDGSVYIYYEYDRIYYKDRKYTIPKRVCIGKRDSANPSEMFPNDKYFEYFPPEASSGIPEQGGGRSSCLKAGAFVVTSFFLRKYKILDWLQERFGKKDGALIADLASSLLMAEENTAQNYPTYAYAHPLFTPDMRIYSDSKIARLLEDTVTRDDIMAFTEWWNRGRDHKRKVFISYASTNKGCGDPVFNVSLALSVKDRLPLFHEDYLGSLVDVSQLEHMADKARAMGYRNIGFVLEEECFSRHAISFLDESGYSFLMMVKGRKELVSSLVLENKGTFENRRSCCVSGYDCNGTTVKTKIDEDDGKERFLHIYHSSGRYATERSDFEFMLRKMADELDDLKGKDCSHRNMSMYEKYYDLSYTGKKDERILVMYSEKTDETERVINLCGYFCIISSDEMDAREALRLSTSGDGWEKLFASDKTFPQSMIQSESTRRSKSFIEFIALILRSRFHSRVMDHIEAVKMRRNYMNVSSVISELEKIELVRIGSGVHTLAHAITARQKEILSLFGMSEDDMKKACRDISTRLKAIDKAEGKDVIDDPDVRDDSRVEEERETEWQEWQG